ncbi:hypothetical protein BD414DRAFT_538471 [Trametes punicea]|nr:hypothetical protein BD414DRAFT_538471 [Trametes punicea]
MANGVPQAHASGSHGFLKRFTTKLRSSSAPEPTPSRPSTSTSTAAISTPKRILSHSHHSTQPTPNQSQPQKKRSGRLRMPPLPKAPVPAPTANDFTSPEQRQAALRARGLLPNVPRAYRDENGYMVPLSEQEAELDRRFTVLVESAREGSGAGSGSGSASGAGGETEEDESEAKKIREAWLARNRSLLQGKSSRGDQEAAHDAASRALATNDENAAPAEADTPSSSAEKVTRWLRSTTDVPTPAPLSTSPSAGPSSVVQSAPLTESPRTSLSDAEAEVETPQAASPAGTVRASTRQRKEKPPPIVVAPPSTRSSRESGAKPLAQPLGRPSDLQSQPQPPPQSQQAPPPPRLAHAHSSTSTGSGSGSSREGRHGGGSRGQTLPALSPTRTVSSFGAESSLPTPTTASCQRDVSIAHSSEQSHGSRGRGRSSAENLKPSTKASAPGGLMQSSIEESFSESEQDGARGEEEDADDGEFGAGGMPAQTVPVGAVVRPRPPRVQPAEQTNRKSFSLFGKKSSDPTQSARSSSSMSNLRRAFTGGLAAKLQVRPRSTVDPGVAPPPQPQPHYTKAGEKRSKMFDASHLPASPTHPPTSFPPTSFPGAFVPLQGRTPGVGLRPRQPVAPTMHDRGSILHQARFIQDEESRRLSEMAFLM